MGQIGAHSKNTRGTKWTENYTFIFGEKENIEEKFLAHADFPWGQNHFKKKTTDDLIGAGGLHGV